MSFFHKNSLAETFSPLINCAIDYSSLETMPDIDQVLLQFINVVNLLDPLTAFLPYFCSQPSSDLCCWVAKGLVK